MENQFRTRGIYRPNAQRLSISLAPLVAQRSLLFRVKADLATKTHYGQLTPTTDESDVESPGLFALTASACLLSAVLTAVASVVSAASVYSQDSWKTPYSSVAPLPMPMPVIVDTRRHAIAFSPSVRWSQLSEGNDSIQEGEMEEVPLSSAASSAPKQPESDNKALSSLATYLPAAVQVAMPPAMFVSKAEGAQKDDKAGGKLKKKKGPVKDAPLRSSKPSTTFSKVMSRISLQPSKKELSAAERRQTTMTISHPMPKFNLADLKPLEHSATRTGSADYKLPGLKTPGPIRMSFIVAPMPQAPAAPALAPIYVSPPTIAAIAENPASDASANDPRAAERLHLLRSTMPATPSWRNRSLTPPPPLPPAPAAAPEPAKKKGHRRYKSSPAVMNFDFHGWDEESAPPLPPIPVIVPVPIKLAPAPPPQSSLRARAQSVAGREHGVRAIAPPFPVSRPRYGSF